MKRIMAALLSLSIMGAVIGAIPPSSEVAPIPDRVATVLDVADTAEPATAHHGWECASWGCAETVWYWPSGGAGKYNVRDLWVEPVWWLDVNDVNACTWMKVRSANSGIWYWVGQNCNQWDVTIEFDKPFPIDKVRIFSLDSRARTRYLTIDG